MKNLDDIDIKILNILKKNARTPLKELSLLFLNKI